MTSNNSTSSAPHPLAVAIVVSAAIGRNKNQCQPDIGQLVQEVFDAFRAANGQEAKR